MGFNVDHSKLMRLSFCHVLSWFANITNSKPNTIQADLHYDAMLVIPCIRRVGGLAMLWKEQVDLHVQNYTQNHIDAHIRTDPSAPWRITSFYGKPKEY